MFPRFQHFSRVPTFPEFPQSLRILKFSKVSIFFRSSKFFRILKSFRGFQHFHGFKFFRGFKFSQVSEFSKGSNFPEFPYFVESSKFRGSKICPKFPIRPIFLIFPKSCSTYNFRARQWAILYFKFFFRISGNFRMSATLVLYSQPRPYPVKLVTWIAQQFCIFLEKRLFQDADSTDIP